MKWRNFAVANISQYLGQEPYVFLQEEHNNLPPAMFGKIFAKCISYFVKFTNKILNMYKIYFARKITKFAENDEFCLEIRKI